MRPFYQDDYCTIYHGDCRVILPQLENVDLMLTDPPYGTGHMRGNSTRGDLAESRDYGKIAWDDAPPPSWLFGLMMEKSKYQVFWGGNYYSLPPTSCWIVWDKDNGATDFADFEMGWTNFKGSSRLFKYRWNGMLQQNMVNKDVREHPTQKPVSLMRWCIDKSPKADTILDPFMGSGTTLRAAKDSRRRVIGVEQEEKYCEIAVRRLAQEVLPF